MFFHLFSFLWLLSPILFSSLKEIASKYIWMSEYISTKFQVYLDIQIYLEICPKVEFVCFGCPNIFGDISKYIFSSKYILIFCDSIYIWDLFFRIYLDAQIYSELSSNIIWCWFISFYRFDLIIFCIPMLQNIFFPVKFHFCEIIWILSKLFSWIRIPDIIASHNFCLNKWTILNSWIADIPNQSIYW